MEWYDRSGGDAMRTVKTLILINAAVFLAVRLMPPLGGMLVLDCAGFFPTQLVTAGFLHTDFWHLVFNMYGLYLFGKLAAPHIGSNRFVWLYIIGAAAGNALFYLLNLGTPFRVLGASGALFAVIVGAMLFEPDRQFVMMFMPFMPMRTVTLVICYTVAELLFQITGADGGVAHLAHLGGAIGGYIYLKAAFGSGLVWDFFRRRPRKSGFNPPPDSFSGKSSGRVSSRELDYLLDKISRYGINSLSPEEMNRLKQAREQMRSGRD